MEKEKKIGEWKDLMVKELTGKIGKDSNLYFCNYTGLKTGQLNELRRLLESHSSRYLVVKNSIIKIALENAGLNGLVKFIDGSVGIVLGEGDPIATAKIIAKFSKSHESLKLKGGYLDGDVIDTDRMKYLASLPSREELIARIVFGIKSPISGFVGVLGNTLKGLVYAIQAIKGKKASGSTSRRLGEGG